MSLDRNTCRTCATPNKNTLHNHIYNLIQYFYVIGIDSNVPFTETFYDINDNVNSDYNNLQSNNHNTDNNSNIIKTFIPKVISKYPNIDLPYLALSNDIIASHAFPNNISLCFNNNNDTLLYNEYFIFSFQNQNPNKHHLHCKTERIYFTCLLFYEQLSSYTHFYNLKFPNAQPLNNTLSSNTTIYVPKVISICSFVPLHYTYYKILHIIKEHITSSHSTTFPIEKLIEHFIYDIPTPPRGLVTINYIYNNNKSFIIEQTPINTLSNPDNDLLTLLNNITLEQIFQMIKCLLLEISLIVFCKDKFILSNIVESLPTLIKPINYIYPIISILPRMNFALLQSLSTYIIGINDEYYESYFNDNKIELGNKNVVIVHIKLNHKSNIIYHKKSTNQPIVNLFNNPNFEYTPPYDVFNVNLPLHYTQKVIKRIKDMLVAQKEKGKATSKTKFNLNVRECFYYYFVCILLYYQDYVVKCSEMKMELYSLYLKGELSISDLINVKHYMKILPKLDREFYKLFFESSLFFNFIAKKVFAFNLQDKLDVILFDEHVNIKLNKTMTHHFKKKTTPFLSLTSFKNIIPFEIHSPLLNNNNTTLYSFTIDEVLYIASTKGKNKLINYFQDINVDTQNNVNINYHQLFPKLINDGVYFNLLYSPYNNVSNTLSIKNDTNVFMNKYISLENICSTFVNSNTNLYSNYKSVDYSIIPYQNGCSLEIKLYVNLLWKKIALHFISVLSSYEKSKLLKEFKKIISFNAQYYDANLNSYLFMKILKHGNTELAKMFYIESKGKSYLKYLSLREKIKKNYYQTLRESSNSMSISNNNSTIGYRSINTSMIEFMSKSNNNKENEFEIVFEKVIKCKHCNGDINIEPNEFVKNFIMVNKNIQEMSLICKHCDQYNVINIQVVICKKNNNTNEIIEYNKINFKLLSCVYVFENKWLEGHNKLNRKYHMEYNKDLFWSCVFYFAVYKLPYKFIFPNCITKTQTPTNNAQYSLSLQEQTLQLNIV